MSLNLAVIGAQWGDEGKGKIVDLLSSGNVLGYHFDVIVRATGGNNAGHTIIINGEKTIFHLIPSGIQVKEKKCVIGNGTVLNLDVLVEEMEDLKKKGVDFDGRLLISDRASVIFPYHEYVDKQRDKKTGIGTTGRGIGPAYTDKAARTGIKISDFMDGSLHDKVRAAVEFLPNGDFSSERINEICEKQMELFDKIRRYVIDTVPYLYELVNGGKNILFEGAQGTMLDVDFGTYPFVTSSNSTAGGSCTGSGVSPVHIDRVMGVTKAYTTRVGGGPFPTELTDELGEDIRKKGAEYGATTGRPRRCGWLDGVVLRYAKMINGFEEIAITKLDVLSGIEKLKVCIGYQIDGKGDILHVPPASIRTLGRCVPVYDAELPGWEEDISNVKKYDDLPKNAKSYIARLEELADAKATIISVGPDREQTIARL